MLSEILFTYVCLYIRFLFIIFGYLLSILIYHCRKRKLNTVIRHNRLMTGGGPALVQLNDPVMEFVDATHANLDVEINCPFDSTAVFEKECKYYT